MAKMDMEATHEARLNRFIIRNKVKIKDGRLVLYKAVDNNYGSVWLGGAQCEGAYRPGTIVSAGKWNEHPDQHCAEGLHVAPLWWVKKEYWNNRYRFIRVYVDPLDVVCVPYVCDDNKFIQKIRCKRLYVAKEIERK